MMTAVSIKSDAVKCSFPFDAVFDAFDAVFTAIKRDVDKDGAFS